MNDYGLSVLSQYGFTAKSVNRGRGTLICETDYGLKVIGPYRGTSKKMEFQYALQKHCKEEGFTYVDQVWKNQEGEVLSKDEEGDIYIVRDWFHGKECDARIADEILECVGALASLHRTMCMDKEEGMRSSNLLEECKKHNRELRKIRKYVQKKKNKNEFEEKLSGSISWFLEQGEETAEKMEHSGYEQLLLEHSDQVCHGECTQHNFLFIREGVAVTNFEHWNYGLQIADLYQFMRKILEKHQWNLELGVEMLRSYQKNKAITPGEVEILKLLLAYPWKYWKLANFYANSNKVWISRKNIEKLMKTIAQADPWRAFLAGFPLNP